MSGEPHRLGSSRHIYPRVYGGTADPCRLYLVKRYGPPCTGEPTGLSTESGRSPVYPRVYGGTQTRNATAWGLIGLSPRVRGNQLVRRCSSEFTGLSPRVTIRGTFLGGSIPACTGEPSCTNVGCRVYPRVYGGTHAGLRSLYRQIEGLSPRVRGNRDRANELGQGSIPACTGEPRDKLSCKVYPRVYGGTCHLDIARPRWCLYRVYPRVYGGTCRPANVSPLIRSIPACAGEPRK